MPRRPRISVTINPEDLAILQELAELGETSVSSVAGELLALTLAPMPRVIAAQKAARDLEDRMAVELNKRADAAVAATSAHAERLFQSLERFTEDANAETFGDAVRPGPGVPSSGPKESMRAPEPGGPDPRIVTRGLDYPDSLSDRQVKSLKSQKKTG